MYTMILLLYLQQNLEVTLDSAKLRGQYPTVAACETAARALRGPVPIPRNVAAAWHDVLCIEVANNVRVNDMAPLDLARALEAYAPLRCQADGAWERVAALCRRPDKDRDAGAPSIDGRPRGP